MGGAFGLVAPTPGTSRGAIGLLRCRPGSVMPPRHRVQGRLGPLALIQALESRSHWAGRTCPAGGWSAESGLRTIRQPGNVGGRARGTPGAIPPAPGALRASPLEPIRRRGGAVRMSNRESENAVLDFLRREAPIELERLESIDRLVASESRSASDWSMARDGSQAACLPQAFGIFQPRVGHASAASQSTNGREPHGIIRPPAASGAEWPVARPSDGVPCASSPPNR